MSELLIEQSAGRNLRRQLLATASSVTLFAAACASGQVMARDINSDRPTVWIELGGQVDHLTGQGDAFPLGFLEANPDSPVLQSTNPLQAQRPVSFAFGEEGKITIQPQGSNWVFSAGIRYGRSNNSRAVHHQTYNIFYRSYKYGVALPHQNPHGTDDFSDTQVHNAESHFILDFMVGKDVGLGLFGRDGSSLLSLGVRFAQFSSKATFDARARPDLKIAYLHATPNFSLHLPYFHTYHLSGQASRNFRGVGPSLSWKSSTPILGDSESGEVALDWGLGAAMLFGRQKTSVEHSGSAHYFSQLAGFRGNIGAVAYQHAGGHPENRSVVVPNVEGFAGGTFRVENFKLSMGYRADFFFGAVDGGIDASEIKNLGFYGPFAAISIGLGG